MTLAELKDQNPTMIALIERAMKENFEIPFTSSRRAENFRRTFYKFRRAVIANLSKEEGNQLRGIKTRVQGKNLIFSLEQGSHSPRELLEALGLA